MHLMCQLYMKNYQTSFLNRTVTKSFASTQVYIDIRMCVC